MNLLDERIKQLEDNLGRVLKLIAEYEEKRDLSSDPREKAEAEKEIAGLRERLAVYQQEFSALRQTPPRWPTFAVSASILSMSEATEFVTLYLWSNRFGRVFEFKVPLDITCSALIDQLVERLSLPWSKKVAELMLSFDFSYSIVFDRQKIPLSQTLRQAGCKEGDVLTLHITAIFEDLLEQEGEKMKDVIYMLTAEVLERQVKLERLWQETRPLTRGHVKSAADSCFSHVDTHPVSMVS
jgi:hypothetical protein